MAAGRDRATPPAPDADRREQGRHAIETDVTAYWLKLGRRPITCPLAPTPEALMTIDGLHHIFRLGSGAVSATNPSLRSAIQNSSGTPCSSHAMFCFN